MMRYMPANNQHIVGLFIKRGYHDALIHRMHREYKRRWTIMEKAIDTHLGHYVRLHKYRGIIILGKRTRLAGF